MYTVLNMGYTPSEWIELTQREKAFIIASIQIKLEEEKKAKRKIDEQSRKAGRRK